MHEGISLFVSGFEGGGFALSRCDEYQYYRGLGFSVSLRIDGRRLSFQRHYDSGSVEGAELRFENGAPLCMSEWRQSGVDKEGGVARHSRQGPCNRFQAAAVSFLHM